MRAPTEDERALALLARVLPAGASLRDECPLAFDPRFGGRLVALEEEGSIRSACSILPRDFVCGSSSIRIGLIGSVATDPRWRGRGCMTRLLDRAERALQGAGCAIALLWADEPAVYASRGYVPFGHEVDYLATEPILARLPSDAHVRAAQSEDIEVIHELYQRHSERVERTIDETRALLACPDMDVLVVPDALGRPQAYACVGRGHDLENVLHEWSGGPDALLALMRAHQERRIARRRPGELVMMTPPTATGLHELLDSIGARRFDGILGLAKPLDAKFLARLLAERTGRRVDVAGAEAASALIAECPSGRRAFPLATAMQAFFPAAGDRAALHHFADSLSVSLGAGPLQPFAWGLDSI